LQRVTRLALIAAVILAVAAPAEAQLLRRAPKGQVPVKPPPADLSAEDAAVWPFPAPDPKAWWDEDWPKAPEAADPLGGGRRLGRGERLPTVDNGVDPSTYRLWGLTPLQWQIVRGDEMVLEVWVRPARTVRQSIIRVTVRRDGKAFVQARAGLACCEPGILRRMGFDAELPDGSPAAFRSLRDDALWAAPREVRVAEGGGAAEAVCVDGTAYDLTLLVPGRARSIRRACDNAEVGQAADVLEAVFRAALGHDRRFDVLYPGGADFSAVRSAYASLIRDGGTLKADPNARPQPPGVEPAPEAEAAGAAAPN
jgi:hypothetical protein